MITDPLDKQQFQEFKNMIEERIHEIQSNNEYNECIKTDTLHSILYDLELIKSVICMSNTLSNDGLFLSKSKSRTEIMRDLRQVRHWLNLVVNKALAVEEQTRNLQYQLFEQGDDECE